MDAPPVRSLWFVLLVLLFLSFLLSFAENSAVIASDSKLRKLAEDGNKKAVRLNEFLDGHSGMLKSSMDFLSTLLILAIGMIVLLMYYVPLRNVLASINAVRNIPGILSFVILMAITAMFYLVIAVAVPKGLAGKNADKTALSMCGFTICAAYVAAPLAWIPAKLSVLILSLFGIKEGENDEDVTEEEIRMMVDIGSESGAIDDDEKEMIHNIFEMDDKPVEDIMTHRTDAVVLWLEDDTEKQLEIIDETNHTRYPVCGDNIDDVLGIVNSRDFYRKRLREDNFDIKTILRKPYFVPESMKADELFSQMQDKNAHFAIVLDEYGGFCGIVTQEDLIEEIVGELYSEYDEPEEEITISKLPDPPNTWVISGSAEIDDVEDELGIEIPDDEYNTFAGLILNELGAVPDDGETAEITFGRMHIMVTRVAEHRIEEAIVTLADDEENAGSESDDGSDEDSGE